MCLFSVCPCLLRLCLYNKLFRKFELKSKDKGSETGKTTKSPGQCFFAPGAHCSVGGTACGCTLLVGACSGMMNNRMC